MCGRFTLSLDEATLFNYLNKHYDIHSLSQMTHTPNYNVAPSQSIVSVIHDGSHHRVGLIKWGFVPHYEHNYNKGIINARAETVKTKNAFSSSFRHRRCLILADGFYEWKRTNQHKIPMRITMQDGRVFPMAGLWTTRTKSDGTKVHTCLIITTTANALMAPIHDRMPVILTEDQAKTWLSLQENDLDSLNQLLKPYDETMMHAYPVDTLVNSPSFNHPDCIKPVKVEG